MSPGVFTVDKVDPRVWKTFTGYLYNLQTEAATRDVL